MTPIDTVYEWPVQQTFYLASYIIQENERQKAELEKIKARRGH